MSSSQAKITDGPSHWDVHYAFKCQADYRALRFTLVDANSEEETVLNAFVDAMVPAKPYGERKQYFIRLTERLGVHPMNMRCFKYNVHNREGVELPTDHPFSLLAQTV